jgi:predicted RNA binding protein YcfA (HicA-like mRNA interferase family)
MRNNTFTFGDLDRLLSELDFTKIIVRGSHVAYEHPSGALLMFPPRRAQEKVDQKTEIVVRKTLDEFGLMERDQFEDRAHKTTS